NGNVPKTGTSCSRNGTPLFPNREIGVPETGHTIDNPNRQLQKTIPKETLLRDSHATERFDRFWKAYPKKRSKGTAIKAWQKLKPSEQLTAEIVSAVERAKTSADWKKENGQFVPYPAT